jgi:putative methyltransferase (TIGR04325 family)
MIATFIRYLIKLFVPPIFLKLFGNRGAILFKKTSLQWDGALKQTSGYASGDILLRCRDALLKVKSGEFPYERDSVLFSEKELFFPLLSALFYVSLKKDKELNLIDFGGSLGSTYYQNKDELKEAGISLKWKIIEQENFVQCGRENFESPELKFYYTIDEAVSDDGGGIFVYWEAFSLTWRILMRYWIRYMKQK